MGSDLFRPRSPGSARRPTDNKQQNGQVVNTPRFAEFGGLSSGAKAGPKSTYTKMSKPSDTKRVI